MNDKLIYKDFDRERIDRGNLILSTAAEALRCGLVTDADYSRFESEIFDELARLITKYTRGESDSVEGGTAAELLGSILYNTDLALSRLSPEAAAVVIFSVRLQNIYLEGLKINREYVLKALSMLRKLKRTKINVMCVYLTTSSPAILRSTYAAMICISTRGGTIPASTTVCRP